MRRKASTKSTKKKSELEKAIELQKLPWKKRLSYQAADRNRPAAGPGAKYSKP